MTKNLKKFNVFVFLSSFARSLIEVFIPLYLYKKGMNFEQILYFYLLIFTFSIFISYIILKIANKIGYKYFMFVCAISFVFTFYFLNIISITNMCLILLALSYTIYRRSYWMVKRYYSIKYSVKRNSGKSSAMITISTQLAGMLSTIIGGLFLDNEQFLVLAFVSLIILFASIIPLFMIKEKKEEKTKPSKYKDILKQIPKQNYFVLFLYESLFFINLLFPFICRKYF